MARQGGQGELAVPPTPPSADVVEAVTTDTATSTKNAPTPTATGPSLRFFTDDDFHATARTVIGRAGYGACDIGVALTTLARITDGGAQSWYAAWTDTAQNLRSQAVAASSAGLMETASRYFLAASDAFGRAPAFVDAVPDDPVLLAMPGYLLRPDDGGAARPTIIVTNGSDGSLSALWGSIVEAGLSRGWNVAVFDGPGQQSMLFEKDVPFRPDWEAVLTPVVDRFAARDDVDESALFSYAISQGGFWMPRALAFEHRSVAAVADGGVMDVSRSWFAYLPKELIDVFDSGNSTLFDQYMGEGTPDPVVQRVYDFRARPFGSGLTPFALYTDVSRYRLQDVVAQITTPMLVTDPDDEDFWPGQSKELFDALPSEKELAPYWRDDGANHHCEPLARSVVGLRMMDFFAGHLARPAA